MKKNIRKLIAMFMVLAMVLGMTAMAENKIVSDGFRLSGVKQRETQVEIPAEEAPIEEEPSAEEPAQEEPTAETPAGETPVEGEPTEENPSVETPVEGEPTEEEPSVEEPVEGETTEEEPSVEEPVEGETTEEEPSVEEPSVEEPVEGETTEEEPSVEEPVEGEAAEEEPSVEEPVEGEAAEEEPAETISTEGLRQIIVTLREGESQLPIYAEVGGEILANIPAGAILYVKDVEAAWSYAVYGDIAGYVNTDSIALFNSEGSQEEQQIIRSISVSANVGKNVTYEGDQIILSAKLSGFDDVPYRLQWQYSPDGGATIMDIPGANDLQYSFIINDDNAAYLWRVCVTLLDNAEEAAA